MSDSDITPRKSATDIERILDAAAVAESARRELREEIARNIETRAREQWTVGTDWVDVAARIARGES